MRAYKYIHIGLAIYKQSKSRKIRDNFIIYNQNIGVNNSKIIVCTLAKYLYRSKFLFITEMSRSLSERFGRCTIVVKTNFVTSNLSNYDRSHDKNKRILSLIILI